LFKHKISSFGIENISEDSGFPSEWQKFYEKDEKNSAKKQIISIFVAQKNENDGDIIPSTHSGGQSRRHDIPCHQGIEGGGSHSRRGYTDIGYPAETLWHKERHDVAP
jgi:hypothetical protein